MRRPVNRLAVLFAASLLMGCTPEPPTPPEEPAKADANLQHSPVKESVGSAVKKKKKEPGPGRAVRDAAVKPNAAL
jgi:hypothetical protein